MSSVSELIKEGLSALERDLTSPPYIPIETPLTAAERGFVGVLYSALTADITADLLDGITTGRTKLDDISSAIQFFRSAAKDSEELSTANYYYILRRFNPEDAALEPEEDDSDYEEYNHFMKEPAPVPNVLELLPENATISEDVVRVAYGAYHTMLQEVNSTAEGFAQHLQYIKTTADL